VEEGFTIPMFALGVADSQLDILQSGQGCFLVIPRSDLPGIEKIIVVFSDDHAELVRKLKLEGVVSKNAMTTYIPRNILEN
jgi:hypothetical protein